MTENEAIKYLNVTKDFAEENSVGGIKRLMCDTAITALKEIQQYREIGTVEECLEAVNMRTPERAIFEYMPGDWEGKFNCPACRKMIMHDCRDTENTFSIHHLRFSRFQFLHC